MVRRLAARDVRWQRFITESRKCLQHQVRGSEPAGRCAQHDPPRLAQAPALSAACWSQASLILREAAPVYQALGLPATKQYVSPPRQNPPPGAPPAAYPRVSLAPGCRGPPRDSTRALRGQRRMLHTLLTSRASRVHPSTPAAQPIYELRRYQLHAGYGSVPKLADAFARGCVARLCFQLRPRSEAVGCPPRPLWSS